MAKKPPAPLGSVGHFDYEPSFDPTDHAVYPHGGYRGRETAGGLSDRNGSCEPTQTRGDGFRLGSMHSNRSRGDGSEVRQLRSPTLEDGVSFSERLRSDLDEDIFQS
jgi:hypothetical protein